MKRAILWGGAAVAVLIAGAAAGERVPGPVETKHIARYAVLTLALPRPEGPDRWPEVRSLEREASDLRSQSRIDAENRGDSTNALFVTRGVYGKGELDLARRWLASAEVTGWFARFDALRQPLRIEPPLPMDELGLTGSDHLAPGSAAHFLACRLSVAIAEGRWDEAIRLYDQNLAFSTALSAAGPMDFWRRHLQLRAASTSALRGAACEGRLPAEASRRALRILRGRAPVVRFDQMLDIDRSRVSIAQIRSFDRWNRPEAEDADDEHGANDNGLEDPWDPEADPVLRSRLETIDDAYRRMIEAASLSRAARLECGLDATILTTLYEGLATRAASFEVGLLPHMLSAYDGLESMERATLIVLALAAFRTDHGGYPASLAELSPAYLERVPEDPLAPDGAFRYRLIDREAIAPNDAFELYSVGPDGRDDGGRAPNLKRTGDHPLDMRLQIGEGFDYLIVPMRQGAIERDE